MDYDIEDVNFDDRKEWPLKELEVDEVFRIAGDAETRSKAQKYAHTYGGKTGKKFKTRNKNEILYIKRVC